MDGRMGKRVVVLTAQRSCLHRVKICWNLVHQLRSLRWWFGDHSIVETHSILGTPSRQWMAGTAKRICAKFTRKTCLVLSSDEFECQGQTSKVKVTRDKNALCTDNTPAVWMECNALVADNVAQAADTTIRSLQRGVIAGKRALGLTGYRWLQPAGLCYASVTFFLLCVTIAWSKEISETARPIICAKTAESIEIPFGFRTRVGPENHVLDGGPDASMARGNFWG